MKKQLQIKVILFGLVILAILMFAGCQKLSNKGTQYTNVAPKIYWADVPIVHQLSRNPVIRYYSTDIDGLVLDYQYCVLLGNAVDSVYGGAAAVAASFPDSAHWTIVHNDSTTISLYANPDTGIYVDQYVFLRAMDDDSALSSIIYTDMARKNHPPTCYMVMPHGPQWCLPETTATWPGIKVAWIGKDSIDIPGIQPDFQWNIRIYGPFSDSATADTLPGNMLISYQDTNQTTGVISDWIKDKGKTLTNLRTGWYILYACNRDDAFTSAIPSLGYLDIYEPRWINPGDAKSILFVDHTTYASNHIVTRAAAVLIAGDLNVNYRDSVIQFYDHLVEAAGYTSDDYDWFAAPGPFTWPPKSVLANYKLVIVLKTDRLLAMSPAQDSIYAEYLNAGGMLWLNGRRVFESSGDRGNIEFGASTGYRLPYNFLNLSTAYCELMGFPPVAQFSGATALIGAPDLPLDTLRVSYTSIDSVFQVRRNSGGDSIGVDTLHLRVYFAQALRGVDALSILPNTGFTSLYTYVSQTPDTSHVHGLPVALRFESSTFRTSYFTFPLYFVQTDQAMAITQNMLQWFFAARH